MKKNIFENIVFIITKNITKIFFGNMVFIITKNITKMFFENIAFIILQLEFTPLTELDYGTFLCWAANSIGR